MRTLRVIFLASLFFVFATSAFAGNSQGGNQTANSQGGKTYAAPEFDFSGPMKSELLLIVGGAAFWLERRRRRRAVSQNRVAAAEPTSARQSLEGSDPESSRATK